MHSEAATAMVASHSDIALEQINSSLAMLDPAAAQRIKNKYRSELGLEIAALLDDPDITDIYRNPHSDWIYAKSLSRGTFKTTCRQTANRAQALIGTIAGVYKMEISDRHSSLQQILPFHGARFTAMVPPLVSGPTWVIRKRIPKILGLQDYIVDGIATEEQVTRIQRFIDKRFNIFVAGPMGAGKTSLCNAILKEMVTRFPDERYGIIEDTPELQCVADDRYEMLTNEDQDVSYKSLLDASLRFGATRLCIGELRSGASTLLEAWTTGHSGGLTTIHGASPAEVMRRFEFLLLRDKFPIDRYAIIQAIKAIVIILPYSGGRIIRHVVEITGCSADGYTFTDR